jgi:glycosidase
MILVMIYLIYYDIDPSSNNGRLDRLIEEAHKRNIKIIMDW